MCKEGVKARAVLRRHVLADTCKFVAVLDRYPALPKQMHVSPDPNIFNAVVEKEHFDMGQRSVSYNDSQVQ